MDHIQEWKSLCAKLRQLPRAPGYVRLETPAGVRVYRNIDEAIEDGDPIAEQVFEGDELETWQLHFRWQTLQPLRAIYYAADLRALIKDPEAAARQLTEAINQELMELLPAVARFLRSIQTEPPEEPPNMDRLPLAVLRGTEDGANLFLCQQEPINPRLPLSRLSAALLELLALDQTLLPYQEDGDQEIDFQEVGPGGTQGSESVD